MKFNLKYIYSKKVKILQSIRTFAILYYFSLIDSIPFTSRTLVYCIDTIFAITGTSYTSLCRFIIKKPFNTSNTIESIGAAVARRNARKAGLIFWAVYLQIKILVAKRTNILFQDTPFAFFTTRHTSIIIFSIKISLQAITHRHSSSIQLCHTTFNTSTVKITYIV
jgi:hypothetical protein